MCRQDQIDSSLFLLGSCQWMCRNCPRLIRLEFSRTLCLDPVPSRTGLVPKCMVRRATAREKRGREGSGRRKISPEPIWDIYDVSPDGRWVAAETPGSGGEEHITMGTTKAFAMDGTATVTLCVGYCRIQWDMSGGFAYFSFPMEGSYALPVMLDSGLPKIPPAAISIEDITNQKAITAIPWEVESAVNPSVYAYTRLNTRRNLYRIPTW